MDLNSSFSAGQPTQFAQDFLRVAAFPGDFNQNGVVDAADYVVWRNGLGTTFTQNDYNVWRAHFGQTAGSGSNTVANTTVPEPATLVMLIVAVSGVLTRRRWRT